MDFFSARFAVAMEVKLVELDYVNSYHKSCFSLMLITPLPGEIAGHS
jgi:hypothetical protein